MPKITPFLWFDDNAEEAAAFYVSIFRNSKLGSIARYPEGAPGKAGSVMTVEFTLDGQDFLALNGGPHFKFNEAISFVVNCKDQAEIDEMWSRLTAGGNEVQCGWLRDKFGLSWQIVPQNMGQLMAGADAEGAKRAMQAMMQMKKLDIAALRRAGGLG